MKTLRLIVLLTITAPVFAQARPTAPTQVTKAQEVQPAAKPKAPAPDVKPTTPKPVLPVVPLSPNEATAYDLLQEKLNNIQLQYQVWLLSTAQAHSIDLSRYSFIPADKAFLPVPGK